MAIVDPRLRVNQLQALGTHNSYHTYPQPPIDGIQQLQSSFLAEGGRLEDVPLRPGVEVELLPGQMSMHVVEPRRFCREESCW